jgi:hypothetical protein
MLLIRAESTLGLIVLAVAVDMAGFSEFSSSNDDVTLPKLGDNPLSVLEKNR